MQQTRNAPARSAHQYDYYTTTDSELTSHSNARPQVHQQRQQFYDDNILLFATEHSPTAANTTTATSQQTLGGKTSITNGDLQNSTKQPIVQTSPQKVRQLEPARGASGRRPGPLATSNKHATGGATTAPAATIPRSESEQSHFHAHAHAPAQGRASRSSQRRRPEAYSATRQQVGKFVQYYPSSRQPTPTRHTSPYSFHVPTATSATRWRASSLIRSPSPDRSSNQYQQLLVNSSATPSSRPVVYQARYGYVAPLDRLDDKQQRRPLSAGHRLVSQTTRSRTLASIPGLVQVSVEDTEGGARRVGPTASPYELYGDDDDEDDDDNYENRDDCNYNYNNYHLDDHGQHRLLRAHRVCVRRPLAGEPTLGQDNPFKPGTELSWEADMMVRLMRRGYPVQELPALVRAAREAHESSRRRSSRAPVASGQTRPAGRGADKLGQQQQQPPVADGNHKQQLLSVSGLDLSQSCKQTWASSLSRAKSAPRIYSTGQPSTGDTADSLDRLITSIELELSQLNHLEREHQKTDQKMMGKAEGKSTSTHSNNKTKLPGQQQPRSKTMQDFRAHGPPDHGGRDHELQERLQERVEQIKQTKQRSGSAKLAGSRPNSKKSDSFEKEHKQAAIDLKYEHENEENSNEKKKKKKQQLIRANKCCMIQ